MPPKSGNGFKIAEWRGEVTATLKAIQDRVERVDANVVAICAKVDCHETDIAVLKEQGANNKLSWGARGVIAASLIAAVGAIAVEILRSAR